MKLKRRLLDAVKESCPTFDETKDRFVIEFEGAGDNFDSFHSFDIRKKNGNPIEGEFDVDLHNGLLYNILEASGIHYNWNNAGTIGTIEYSITNPCALEVTTRVETFEDYGTVEDSDDDEETNEE